MTDPAAPPLLSAENLTKAYSGVKALLIPRFDHDPEHSTSRYRAAAAAAMGLA